MIVVPSPGIRAIPYLDALLDANTAAWQLAGSVVPEAVAGWGRKPSGHHAERLAKKWGVPSIRLEDGFLRAYGTSDRFPALSLVVDPLGIYYDATRPSSLEVLLDSSNDVLEGIAQDVARAKALILEHRLSKYNHAPDWQPDAHGSTRVLIVDQTAGDLSLSYGNAGPETFASMLRAARDENPDAVLYVKTHPEVASGRKRGHYAGLHTDKRSVLISHAVNPQSLLTHMDKVYVATSQLGFEALLAGKPVACFGLPWYAGWGVTADRQTCPRRSRPRTVDELFAAAYFHYTRYLAPVTRERGTIFDVIDWLIHQKKTQARSSGRSIAVGLRRWKAANLAPLLSLHHERVHCVADCKAASKLKPRPGDRLVVWGRNLPPGLSDLASTSGADLVHVEDGFYRSVGLGSDLVPPSSLAIDKRGIYFDPTRESDLEHILAYGNFSVQDRARARSVRHFIVEHGLTKYNLEPRNHPDWGDTHREIVFVPGQVEDDASLRYGAPGFRDNLTLLRTVRNQHPHAFIVFKPHPDVQAGNRKAITRTPDVLEYADLIETRCSITSCIDAADRVCTLTSLSGFEALLRKKPVETWGRPFYAGWGLTHDFDPPPRRGRKLTLDELVAGALLRYPLYWDDQLQGYTSCEAVLQALVAERNDLERQGKLEMLRSGKTRRWVRKVGTLWKSWLTGR